MATNEPIERLRVRFFRDIVEADRRSILTRLGAIDTNDTETRLNHNIESKLFTYLAREGHAGQIERMIDNAVAASARASNPTHEEPAE
ncbi:hypothetical protein [Burkholderia cenocepacia]|uniref:hypothetical protein n=1 Tax=Burkholderia cenocepacia TaxID=95486 RepID=UPI002867514C|nr:hypothetical protein [Burkholderia cenocepacia]MDR8054223.1 hypothetical protein [Burkholderia cenocepacia]MDR8064666.1 hypothetical protein [Burkholderia cenocepacia]